MEKGSFSLLNFYERRARRILPALFFVTLCILPFLWFWMLPRDLKSFSESLVAVSLFSSNIFFCLTSGYFDSVSEVKPLLHTWSLALEEQYYVLFPLFLMLTWKLGKKWIIPLLLTVTVISVFAAQWGSSAHPSFTFYLLPTRGFEILIGSLISLSIGYKSSTMLVDQLASVAGLLLILYAIFVFDKNTPTPSFYTLIPTIGAGLILVFASTKTLVGRLLGNRILVGIGLISYSAYLWHHPLFVVARLINMGKLTSTIFIILSLSSLVLGYLSWKYVENPFRNRMIISRRSLFTVSLTLTFTYFIIGLIGYFTNGFEYYWLHNRATYEQLITYNLLLKEKRESAVLKVENRVDDSICAFDVENLTSKVADRIVKCSSKFDNGIAVIGDSHATNLFGSLYFNKKSQFIVGITKNACHLPEVLSDCPYNDFLNFVEKYPKLFKIIIYEKAGYLMLQHSNGNGADISGLTLNEELKGIKVNLDVISGVSNYLIKLSRYTHVIWFGPHIEPQISEELIMHNGCNFKFNLRKNQWELYKDLDHKINEYISNLRNSKFIYISQNDLYKFEFPRDFMNCNSLFWVDENHYSKSGEKYFSSRLGSLDIMSK